MNHPINTLNSFSLSEIVISSLIGLLISAFLFSLLFFILISLKWKIYSFKNITLLKKIVINFLFGFFISFISILMYQVSIKLDASYLIFSQIPIFMICSLFFSTFTMLGISPGFLVINCIYIFKIMTSYDLNYVIFLFIFYALSFIWVFISRFIFETKITYVLITSFFLFALIVLLALIIFDNSLFFNYLVLISLNYVLFFILYLIAFYINNLFLNTYRLKTSIKYDNDVFVNNGYSEIAFKQYIKKHEIETGLFITFDFLNIDKLLYEKGKGVLDETQKMFLKYIMLYFGKNCLYFKTKNNEYGIFFKIPKNKLTLKKSVLNNYSNKRPENDFLKNYELIFNEFPNKINFNNNEYDISISCFCSIYGIHSTNFNKLEEFNEITRNNFKDLSKQNIVKIYDYKKNINFDLQDFVNKKNELLLDNAEISLVEKKLNIYKQKKKMIVLTSELFWTSQNVFNKNDLTFLDVNEKDKIFISRNIAYRSLKLFNNYLTIDKKTSYKLLLSYEFNYLNSEDFNLFLFNKVFDKFHIKLNQIVLCINLLNVNNNIGYDQFISNILKIKEMNIQIAFENVNLSIKDEDLYQIADYLIFKNQKEIKKIDLTFINNKTMILYEN